MAESVELNPEGLRKSATEFEGVSATTKAILDKLQGASAAKGAPWGDDKNGKKFAEGEKGYITNRDGMFNTLSQLVTVFADNANNLRDSANTFEQNEKNSSQ
ncbi:hypothetical protein [Nocardia macrotermitis]|uniref:WXG100 family type VII secretion target n=1 Tax=Nocardia macrotermitis TaxID=2585198 RepID=A0A7K0D1F8_9NOCA|nr:hypothetical protein [Nocardia macrotermitis]MQY19537.1 hypothetical protein [Nocardia macrotermitis]